MLTPRGGVADSVRGGFASRQVDRGVERQGAAIRDDVGSDTPDSTPHHSCADQHATLHRRDVHVDMCAWQQPCRPFDQRTRDRHIDHTKLTPCPQPDPGQRLRRARRPTTAPATLSDLNRH